MSNVVVSPSSGNFVGKNSSFADVPKLQVTITTRGGIVLLMLRPAAIEGIGGSLTSINESADQTFSFFRFRRGSSPLPVMKLSRTGTSQPVKVGISVPCSAVSYIDTPPAGTHTYALQARAVTPDIVGGPHLYFVDAVSLVALEINGGSPEHEDSRRDKVPESVKQKSRRRVSR
jgi:hypothetical protein